MPVNEKYYLKIRKKSLTANISVEYIFYSKAFLLRSQITRTLKRTLQYITPTTQGFFMGDYISNYLQNALYGTKHTINGQVKIFMCQFT